MAEHGSWLKTELTRHGVSRREFMAFCTTMATALSLPASVAAQIARAVARTEKPVLVWLEFQDCAGNTESFLRAPSNRRRSGARRPLGRLPRDDHGGGRRAGRRELARR